MKYVRLCKSVQDKGILVPEDKVMDLVDTTHDWYQSAFYYNQEQYDIFKKTGSIRNIEDVTTTKLYFDLDDKTDPARALLDARTIVKKLHTVGDPEIYFSGQKGLHIIVETNKEMTPEQVSFAAQKLAGKLPTMDLVVYNASRILRVPGTKHQKTGLYKFPLTKKELLTLSIDEIKAKAKSLDNAIGEYESGVIELTPEDVTPPKKAPKVTTGATKELDLSDKPPHWKNYKWALAQGHFESGERHQALMVVAATCRGLGYDKETTYYICKSALKKQAERTGSDDFPKEELWNNIIEQSVFSENWNGGQFSPKTNPWLAAYCERMGIKIDTSEEEPFVDFGKMTDKFLDYANNFEQNIIKTGIKELDDNVMYSTSTLNGLLGNPGAGKTSLAMEFLRNSSINGVTSVFFSMDMGLPVVYAKLIQKAAGVNFKQALDMVKYNPKKTMELIEQIKEEYKNVGFNFKSGLSVKDMESFIKYHEDQTGKKVRLVVADYLECISSKFSDPGASCGLIANELKDLANDQELCVQLLLQTQKHSTPDISDPLLSLKNVKGNSLIEQACTTITTLWREGYNPDFVNDDKYISFAVVKNRFGSLWRGDCAWSGKTGSIRSMTEEEWGEFAAFKERKRLSKIQKEKESNGQWE
jgi:hypothetical protein